MSGTLRYGRGAVAVPAGILDRATVAAARVPAPSRPAQELLRERLAHPIDSPPFRSLLNPADSLAIVVSDITRYSATEVLLPVLLEESDAAGVPRGRVTVFVARGTHRAQTVDELRRIVGPAIDSGIRVAQSDPDGPVVEVGRTARGTPVRLSMALLEHDRIAITGTLSFHYFAGFGGGRKALVPGCAARETAVATHSHVFLPDRGKHPRAASGVLDGNPVHEDLVEAVSMAPPAFLLNTLLGPDGMVFDAVAGHWRTAHEEGARRYAAVFGIGLPGRFPLVVASAGGFPKDINFIQAHKALDHAFLAVATGGTLVLLAECPDGFGSAEFFPWFRHGDADAMETALREGYRIYGQTAHATRVKTQACRVVLVSSLQPDDVRAMGMTPAESLDEALRIAARLPAGTQPALVLPDAGFVLPHVVQGPAVGEKKH